jgi:hypothetical protein
MRAMTGASIDYEKLGVFYLGKRCQDGSSKPTDELILYDSRDLTTHAVCVGMTGSGKTGLCIALLEEALIDGIPVIAIDPKGDLGNLMLTFPELRPADFAPWIDPGAATRQALSTEALAEKTAQQWSDGLASWHQSPERIARLKNAGEVLIYTPGSEAGRGLSILRSFAAPSQSSDTDPDSWRDQLESAVSSLLSLVGIEADPLRSREHVFLSQVIDRRWKEGRDVDLAMLVGSIQEPGFERIGAFDLETFYPAKERMQLAITLNTLLASPAFGAWMQGDPLDLASMLYTPQGKPRIAVVSIAHLSDAERMFIVTLLLQAVVAWVRQQPGTSSLRALLFMDEVFGFLPPTAMPPSKKPLLTLLKQARAHGLGVVLATQNPVDLDYKALSNAGTWFLGRLQTERDKARVIDGLEGASAAAGKQFNRAAMEATLAGLSQRVFVLNNVHEDQPLVFHSRWAMSYLCGPLTRAQISRLMAGAKSSVGPAAAAAQVHTVVTPTATSPSATAGSRPLPPAGLDECFLSDQGPLRPALFATAKAHFVDTKQKIDAWQDLVILAPLEPSSAGDFWATAQLEDAQLLQSLQTTPPEACAYAPLPAALDAKSAKRLEAGLEAWIHREASLGIWVSPELGLSSRPGEDEAQFRARLAHQAREHRDGAIEKLRAKYAPKLARLDERIRSAEARVEREQAQVQQQQMQSAISIGSAVLGALFGRKLVSGTNVGRAAGAARGLARGAREKDDVVRADESRQQLEAQRAEIEAACQAELAALEATPASSVTQLSIKPRKSDITITRVALAWIEE